MTDINRNDFIIQDGTLLKYDGPGGDVAIPEGVKAIGNDAFWGCADLTGITIPDSVEKIGDRAFSHCANLASVEIPASVKTINYCAFSGCASLASVAIPDGAKKICCNAFSGCANLASISIPSSVEEIGNAAFSGCSGLKDVYYADAREQWEKIEIGCRNDELLDAAAHFDGAGRDAHIRVIDGVEYVRLDSLGVLGDLLKRNLPAHD